MDDATFPLNTARQALRLLCGLGVVVLGIVLLVIAGSRAPSTGSRVGAFVFAGVLFVVAIALTIGGAASMRPRAIVVTNEGLRYDSKSRPWRVRWSELRSVRVVTGYHLSRSGTGVAPKRLRQEYVVRLVLQPADGSFAQTHPTLRRFHGRFGGAADGYGFPLGPMRELAEPLDAALRARAGSVYLGLDDVGELPPGLL